MAASNSNRTMIRTTAGSTIENETTIASSALGEPRSSPSSPPSPGSPPNRKMISSKQRVCPGAPIKKIKSKSRVFNDDGSVMPDVASCRRRLF